MSNDQTGRPSPPLSTTAVLALVLGILSFTACPLVLAVPAIVLGRRGKREVARGEATGGGLATAGTVLGIVNVVLVVLVVAAVAILAFAVDDSREDLSVDGGDPAPAATGEAPASLDGTWTVVPGGDTRAQMSITEDLTVLPDHTATGETPGVTGSLTVAGTQVTAASFTVDLTQLEFTDDPGVDVANRRRALEDQGLEIGRFPEASFTLTAPIEIGDPQPGETLTAEATGDLTLHGVTREITFTVEARLQGAQIRVAAADAIPVVLADHDIEKPRAPVIASIADEGTFDFLIVLEQP